MTIVWYFDDVNARGIIGLFQTIYYRLAIQAYAILYEYTYFKSSNASEPFVTFWICETCVVVMAN